MGIVTVLVSVVGTGITSYVIIKSTLARHDEKFSAMRTEIDDMKEEKKELRASNVQMLKLLNKVNTTVAVLEERTKP